MTIWGRLQCLIGKHHRSRSQIRETDGGTFSVCRHCGLPMARDKKRRWRVKR